MILFSEPNRAEYQRRVIVLVVIARVIVIIALMTLSTTRASTKGAWHIDRMTDRQN
jgi:hypothetical protein